MRPGTKSEKKETFKKYFSERSSLSEPGLDWRHRAVPGNSRWYQPEKRRGAIPDPGGFASLAAFLFYRGKRIHMVSAVRELLTVGTLWGYPLVVPFEGLPAAAYVSFGLY